MTIRESARALLTRQARDLHGIQSTAKAMITRVIGRLKHYPEAKARLEAHLTDKDNEMSRLEKVLSGLGERPSNAKDKTMAAIGSAAAVFAGRLTEALAPPRSLRRAMTSA